MKRVIIYIMITAFCFSTMEVALKLAGAGMDSLQLTFLRFFFGGLLLAPFAVHECKTRGYRPDARDLRWLFLVGLMCIPVSMLAYQLGVVRSNAATAAALMCTNPLFTMLIAHIFTSEKMNKIKALAFAISMIALVFLVRPWDIQEGNTVLGLALMVFSAITFAAYTVMGRQSVARIGTFTQTSISFILGSLVLLIFIMATGRPVFSGVLEHWFLVLYISLVVTGVGYLALFLAVKASDATTGSIAFFVKPVLAPIWAVLFLRETIAWNTYVGIALLLLASFLTISGRFVKRGAGEEQ